jgi:hypothetical protein
MAGPIRNFADVAPADPLETLRAAAQQANSERVDTAEVRQALDALRPILRRPQDADEFWISAGSVQGPTASRSAMVRYYLLGIERQLERHNDDAPWRNEWKGGARDHATMAPVGLSDAGLLERRAEQPCAYEGTCPKQDELAAEVDRRELDL